MDLVLGHDVVKKDLKPKYTIWNPKTVQSHITDHKRKTRRIYKQYLKTGDVRLFNKSQKTIARRDFD